MCRLPVNLSSSRFGIGQFNRANYGGSKITHQLQEVNKENQLIFIGPFYTRFGGRTLSKKY